MDNSTLTTMASCPTNLSNTTFYSFFFRIKSLNHLFGFDVDVANEKDNHKDGNGNFVARVGTCGGGIGSDVAVPHCRNRTEINIDKINKHFVDVLVNPSCEVHGIFQIEVHINAGKR